MTKMDIFSLSILKLFVLFCIPGTCLFCNSWTNLFFSIRDQIINFHAAFWGRFLQCGQVTMNAKCQGNRKNKKKWYLLVKYQVKIRVKAPILRKSAKYHGNLVTIDHPWNDLQNLCNDFLYILVNKNFSLQVCLSFYLVSLKMTWFPDTF